MKDIVTIQQLINKYRKELSDIKAGIPEFEAMGIRYKVELQKSKAKLLVGVIRDLEEVRRSNSER